MNTPELAAPVLRALDDIPFPSTNAERPSTILLRCPRTAETPLVDAPWLAAMAGVAAVSVKDERGRMGLGSFKALGAAYVIARDAEADDALGRTYATASAGNHGLSVAAGAAAFGAKAVIFLAETVPAAFAARLEAEGAEVIRAGPTYEEAMATAAETADARGWRLLSDSSWPGYVTAPHTLMEGYLVLMQEAAAHLPVPPSHIFLQAGVGGFAAACAAYARKVWGDMPRIVVVEPEVATALLTSMRAGAPATAPGPVSEMGRLDCKDPSLIALKGLARDANDFITISETQGGDACGLCAAQGLRSTPSGTAGIAGLLAAAARPTGFGLDADARVLVIVTETAAA